MKNNKRSYWKNIEGIVGAFPKKTIIDKIEITDTKTIAKTCNNFFVTTGLNLASNIPKIDTNFQPYISKANTKLHEKPFNKGGIFGSI